MSYAPYRFLRVYDLYILFVIALYIFVFFVYRWGWVACHGIKQRVVIPLKSFLVVIGNYYYYYYFSKEISIRQDSIDVIHVCVDVVFHERKDTLLPLRNRKK